MAPSKQLSRPGMVIIASGISLGCLLLLHFLSPEFEPNWRMVSEYALGRHKWLITLFFIFWGLGSILLAGNLWQQVNSRAARVGVGLLFVSGVGAALAALFDVRHPVGHGVAGLLGIPTVPLATLLITYHLSKKHEWLPVSGAIKFLAHGTWIMLVLMVVTMVVMMNGFQNAGIKMGPDLPPPAHVPDGVIALAGYVNRLLILVDILWLMVVANTGRRISASGFSI